MVIKLLLYRYLLEKDTMTAEQIIAEVGKYQNPDALDVFVKLFQKDGSTKTGKGRHFRYAEGRIFNPGHPEQFVLIEDVVSFGVDSDIWD